MPLNVIVVGAGPVGAVLTLALARADVRVTLLEAETEIDDSPRAAMVLFLSNSDRAERSITDQSPLRRSSSVFH